MLILPLIKNLKKKTNFMTTLNYMAIALLTFLVMECITWFTHKYVMHGFLWVLHKDHHQPKYNSIFEKNDTFFLVFSYSQYNAFLLWFFSVFK